MRRGSAARSRPSVHLHRVIGDALGPEITVLRQDQQTARRRDRISRRRCLVLSLTGPRCSAPCGRTGGGGGGSGAPGIYGGESIRPAVAFLFFFLYNIFRPLVRFLHLGRIPCALAPLLSRRFGLNYAANHCRGGARRGGDPCFVSLRLLLLVVLVICPPHESEMEE